MTDTTTADPAKAGESKAAPAFVFVVMVTWLDKYGLESCDPVGVFAEEVQALVAAATDHLSDLSVCSDPETLYIRVVHYVYRFTVGELRSPENTKLVASFHHGTMLMSGKTMHFSEAV